MAKIKLDFFFRFLFAMAASSLVLNKMGVPNYLVILFVAIATQICYKFIVEEHND